MKCAIKAEFGDFQTPRTLAREVCQLLVKLGEKPAVILEPTVGRGAFLLAASEAFPNALLHGNDINADYIHIASKALETAGAKSRSQILCEDFFTCDWEAKIAQHSDHLLILGNPPWVTNAGLGALGSSNLPTKENFQGLRGIAARTGKANFDISEWMLIRLLRALRQRSASFAMLCKTATARKFLSYAWQNDGRIASATLYRIDAAEHFGATVDACLLYFQTGSNGPHEANVYSSLIAETPSVRIGLAGGEIVADIESYRKLRHHEGLSLFRWRSGVKHDCAAIMELYPLGNGRYSNGLGEQLQLEPDYIFPFLKCSDLANGRTVPTRAVIITQRFVGDDTASIAERAPRTWAYLQAHRDRFFARKSSIYKSQVPFALFGIGKYSFAPWKVAVSGLHRTARFQVIGPVGGQPVFFDDASYYLSFEHEEEARNMAKILNSPICQQFLSSLIFTDSKRPITVDLLRRLNLASLAAEAGLSSEWEELKFQEYAPAADLPQMELLMEEPSR